MSERSVETLAITSRGSWRQKLSRVWPALQLIISLVIVSSVLLWLMRPHQDLAKSNLDAAVQKPLAVEAIRPFELSVQLDSPLGKRLTVQSVEPLTVTDPVLRVTGSVVTSRRPGNNGDPDFWQFHSADLLRTYSALEKALADEEFALSQVIQIRELAEAKKSALERSITRLQKLVRTGTETERDLAAQQTELMQTEIQNRKDVYQAEVAVKSARRDVLTLGLQLRQSGLDPERLRKAPVDLDILSADVPEALLGRVALGQSCVATFFGLPNEVFHGKISVLSPVLSTEQRTLRVLIDITDPQDRLRPGMFASIGLGTDARSVLRIPASGVVHLGRKDYVFREESPVEKVAKEMDRLHLHAVEVDVGESINGLVEIRSGISSGELIVDNHAILLKPILASSLRLPPAMDAASNGSDPATLSVVGERP